MPDPHPLSSFLTPQPKNNPNKTPHEQTHTTSDRSSSPRQTESPRNLDSCTKPFAFGVDQTEKEELDQNTFGPNVLMNQGAQQYQSIRQRLNKKKPTYRRPSTLIQPKYSIPNKIQNNDNVFQFLKITPDALINHTENDDQFQISIRPFQSKFIRELNFKENERYRKNRKKVHVNMDRQTFENSGFKQKKTIKPYNRKQMHEMWCNGIKIISEFKNEIIHGQTEIYYPNGAKFIGKYEQGVRIFGSFDFNNGYVYWGGFLGDKFEGQGHITLPNGKVYSGEWSSNQLVGKVEIKYQSGDVYYGEVKNFKKHGKGYLFFKTGQKFVGQFQNGEITGKGQYFIDEQCIGRGIWKNGELIISVGGDQNLQLFDDMKSYASSKKSLQQMSNKEFFNLPINEEDEEDQLIMDGVEDEPTNIYVRNNCRTFSINEIESQNERKQQRAKETQSAPSVMTHTGKDKKQTPSSRRQSSQAYIMAVRQKHQPLNAEPQQPTHRNHKNTKQLTISFCEPTSPVKQSPCNSQDVEQTTSKNLIKTEEIMDICNDFPIPNYQKVENRLERGFSTSDSSQESLSSLIKNTGRFRSIGSIIPSKQGTLFVSTDFSGSG